MSDIPPPLHPEDQKESPFAEQFHAFRDAIDALYIKGNLSGRNHFREDWPPAAIYIFPPDLLKYDEDGAPDKEYRAKLEEEAEIKRTELFALLEPVEEESTDFGTLQIEYVEGLVNSLGRPLALFVYSKKIVDNIIAPLPGEEVEEEEKEEGSDEDDQLAPEPVPEDGASEAKEKGDAPAETPALKNLEDDVQPIDLGAPPAAEEPASESTPVAAPAPAQTGGGSGLNLAAKRNIVQVDFIESKAVSYEELLGSVEEDEGGEPPHVVPEPVIEATELAAPPLQSPPEPPGEELHHPVEEFPEPPSQKILLKTLFNQRAQG